MRSLKHRELAFLLVGSLAAATPTFAKDGADDGSKSSSGNSSSSTSGTSGTSGTSATSGTSGTSGTSATSGTSSSSGTLGASSTTCIMTKTNSSTSSSSTSTSNSRCGFRSSKTLPVTNVSFKKSTRRNGNIQNIELIMRIGKNGSITQSNFDNDVGTLSAFFPGNIVCEMAGVNQSRNTFTYLLRAKAWRGVADVRVGTCESRAILPATPLNTMPVVKRGNNINFVYDADGDATTTTDIVDVGTIRFR